MPPIFKALATITAWTLFIGGWIVALMTTVEGIIGGQMWTLGAEGEEFMFAWMALAFVCLTLSVVVMKLRQMLE